MGGGFERGWRFKTVCRREPRHLLRLLRMLRLLGETGEAGSTPTPHRSLPARSLSPIRTTRDLMPYCFSRCAKPLSVNGFPLMAAHMLSSKLQRAVISPLVDR
jgi:hypothetical protein